MKRPPIGIDETPSSTRAGANAPAALLDDLELTAQRNLALARLNSSPLPPIQTNQMGGGGAGVGVGVNGGGPAGPGPNPTEQSLYSHLYGKEMGLMRKLTSIDDYPNHAAVARNYQQLLQQQQQQQQHPDPTSGQHHQQMQQNFAGHPHAAATAAAAKFNQFNYPNPGGLLKPCYDYTSQQQHQMQGPGSTAANTGTGPNQQMKKEIFNLSGTNGVDLYPPPATSTPSSVALATTPSSNGAGFMNLHQPSAAAAAAAAAAAMYANHFNNGGGPNSGKLDANGDGGLGGLDFNTMRNNATNNGGKPGTNNLIKSAESVLMARSSIMNNLNNNLNKIEPNTDTTLNDSNNNHPQQQQHHQQQQQGHNHGLGFGGGPGGGGGSGPGDDEIDKLSSPMTGTSTLTNTDLNDPEQDDADDGYTIL